MGLLEDRKKSQYLQMAEEKLQGLLNIPMQAQRFITSPTAFLGLLGQNPLPRESGFAAGATGLPPTEMSVLDPNQAPYMQGYGQGEPVGYAGMALPFAAPAAVATGRALAPKAGQAIESYMVNQGLLQPLTAYHGTPHNIQGKFDINKVGTGEGAQAFGHGMYFAENQAVAEGYKTALSNVEMSIKGSPLSKFGVDERVVTHSPNIFEKPLDYGLAEYNKTLKTQLLDYPELINDPNYAKELFDQRIEYLKSWGKGTKEAKAGEALESFAKKNGYPEVNMGGNLYKVDIPDADIPNMLNWDLPISQQSAKVQEIARQLDPNLLADTPHLIVRGQARHWTEVVDNIEDLQNPRTMKLLKKIYGEGAEIMPYGDYLASKMTGEQLYRNLSNPTQWAKEAAPYAMKAGMEDAAVSAKLNKLGVKGIRYKDAMSRGADDGTSNFVVFDPSKVKILEKNKKKVEGLLD
jgi:hypothetical protein